MPLIESSIYDAIAEYSVRFHAALGAEHGAASPLGAWLLLAMVAPAARGSAREELERTLGCPSERASAFARRALENPHRAVRLAIAAWNNPERMGQRLVPWLDAFPDAIERGAIPSKEAADTWVRTATKGQLKEFPLAIDPRTVLLLASALSADSEWHSWFELVAATEFGNSPWAGKVKNALADRTRGFGTILKTESAGLVAAQVKTAKDGFYVASVIAAPEVPHAVAMAAAYEVAAAAVEPSERVQVVSLYDLPLGDGHAWSLTEEKFKAQQPNVQLQSARVVLPAWHAPTRSINLLKNPAFGLGAAAIALIEQLPPNEDGYDAEAVQATTARFDRPGFSAASVTALLIMDGMAAGPGRERTSYDGYLRHVDVRFNRPYAAVAIASAKLGEPWHGLPFVSAWVTEPTEPDTRERPYGF